jgi:hypothetical protein
VNSRYRRAAAAMRAFSISPRRGVSKESTSSFAAGSGIKQFCDSLASALGDIDNPRLAGTGRVIARDPALRDPVIGKS